MENDDVSVLRQTVQNVQPKNARLVYLLTYSQADPSLVPERGIIRIIGATCISKCRSFATL